MHLRVPPAHLAERLTREGARPAEPLSPSEASPAEPRSVLGLDVVTPEQLGGAHATWEVFQQPGFLDILARHYDLAASRHHGMSILGRHVPVLGMVRAKLYSPEAAVGATWHRRVDELPIGRLDVLTNVRAPGAVGTPVSPPDLYAFVIDLRRGAHELFARFSPQARKVIRRAERAGMTVRRTADETDLASFHEVVLRVTRGGADYEVPELALLRAIMRARYGRLYVLEHGGRVVGGQFLLVHRSSQAFLLAYDRQACHGLPGNLLYWRVMQGEIEAGMPFLDLGAQSLSLHPGLTTVKRSFSPSLLAAWRYELSPSRWRCALDEAWRWRRPAAASGQRPGVDRP